MTQRRGISGDEIRREQEESRLRSRLGVRADARQLRPSLSIIVTSIEIDWLMPLAACAARGFGKVGLVLAAVAIGLDFFSSRIVTIWSGDDGVHAAVRKPWQRAARARQILIDSAHLHYWNIWFCRGLELVGATHGGSVERIGDWAYVHE